MDSNCTYLPGKYADTNRFAFEFERNFRFCDWTSFVRDRLFADYYLIAIVYLITIFQIQQFMRSRKAFDLKTPLFAWNCFLAIFSIIGFSRNFPEFVTIFHNEGLYGTVCNRSAQDGASGLWGLLFVLSKVPEMIDTVFLVLRKKPLIFLHYYHHAQTAAFSLYTFSEALGVSRYYVTMNYAVHSVMYSYYAISSLGYKPSKSIAMAITTSQVIQMFIGFFATISAIIFWHQNPVACHGEKWSLYSGFATYLVYVGLFTDYFVKAYFKSGNHNKQRDINSNFQSDKNVIKIE